MVRYAGHGVHCQCYPKIPTWVHCPMFCPVESLQFVVLMCIYNYLGILLYRSHPFILLRNATSLLHLQMRRVGISGCLRTSGLRSGAPKRPSRSIRFVQLTNRLLKLKAGAIAICPTALLVLHWVIVFSFVQIMISLKNVSHY